MSNSRFNSSVVRAFLAGWFIALTLVFGLRYFFGIEGSDVLVDGQSLLEPQDLGTTEELLATGDHKFLEGRYRAALNDYEQVADTLELLTTHFPDDFQDTTILSISLSIRLELTHAAINLHERDQRKPSGNASEPLGAISFPTQAGSISTHMFDQPLPP